jgi:hypothetical protein
MDHNRFSHGWVPRQPGRDFRNINWGMNRSSIEGTESLERCAYGPVLSYTFDHHGLQFSLTYLFAEHTETAACVGAMLNPRVGMFSPWEIKGSSMGLREVLEMEGNSELEELSSQGRYDERRKKSEENLRRIHQALEIRQAKMREAKRKRDLGILDSSYLETIRNTYEQLKAFISSDYGTPAAEDDEVHEDPEYVKALAENEGVDISEKTKECKTTIWQDENTQAQLHIKPMIGPQRIVQATFASLRHQHLFGPDR